MTRAGAVVLAAGRSTRLGEFKPLLRLGGRTLLERAAALLRAAGVEQIMAVAGHRAEEVAAEAARLGLGCARNPDSEGDMLSSVRAGLEGLAAGPDTFFLLPVDVPLVRPHSLRLLLERHGADRADVLHPVFGGLRGHPPLVAARRVPDLLAWRGAGGLRGALEALGQAKDVPVADRNIHFDLDTPEDLAEARLRAAREDIPAPAEAEALLALHGGGEHGLAHGRGVAGVALALALALVRTPDARGAALDLELVESAALLHDIAKGQPGHEQAGAALLEGLGYGPVARIVAAHRDIAPPAQGEAPQLTERELVYLADKLVQGGTRVSLERRFGQKLERFAHDAGATAAIRRRLANALHMLRRVEAAAGARLEAILGAP